LFSDVVVLKVCTLNHRRNGHRSKSCRDHRRNGHRNKRRSQNRRNNRSQREGDPSGCRRSNRNNGRSKSRSNQQRIKVAGDSEHWIIRTREARRKSQGTAEPEHWNSRLFLPETSHGSDDKVPSQQQSENKKVREGLLARA
jgi:hypothetical protein